MLCGVFFECRHTVLLYSGSTVRTTTHCLPTALRAGVVSYRRFGKAVGKNIFVVRRPLNPNLVQVVGLICMQASFVTLITREVAKQGDNAFVGIQPSICQSVCSVILLEVELDLG